MGYRDTHTHTQGVGGSLSRTGRGGSGRLAAGVSCHGLGPGAAGLGCWWWAGGGGSDHATGHATPRGRTRRGALQGKGQGGKVGGRVEGGRARASHRSTQGPPAQPGRRTRGLRGRRGQKIFSSSLRPRWARAGLPLGPPSPWALGAWHSRLAWQDMPSPAQGASPPREAGPLASPALGGRGYTSPGLTHPPPRLPPSLPPLT